MFASRSNFFIMINKLVHPLLRFFLLAVAINKFHTVHASELYLQQIEVKTPSKVPGIYEIPLLRVSKFNRTSYVLNAEIDLETTIGDDYSVGKRCRSGEVHKTPYFEIQFVCVHPYDRWKSSFIIVDSGTRISSNHRLILRKAHSAMRWTSFTIFRWCRTW